MILLPLLLFLSGPAAAADHGACDALVVYQSGSEAYDAAVSGLRESLANAAFRVEYLDLADPAGHQRLGEKLLTSPKVVAAVGIGAWDRLASYSGPVVPAMVLREEVSSRDRRAGAVYANVPLAAIAANLQVLFPGRNRLALIHRAPFPAPDAGAVAHLKQMGFELMVVECPGPQKLMAALASMKGKADFAVAEPDPELYNSATVKPLVLASLESGLPLVGFSAAFVRAGALAGVYPDFRDLGRQTGDLLARILSGKPSDRKREEDARKVVVAVNERIARLMGIEPADRSHAITFR